MDKSFRLTAFRTHGRESQNCTLPLLPERISIYHLIRQLEWSLSTLPTFWPKFRVFMENCSQFDWWNPKMSKMAPKISNCADSNRGLQCWHCSWRSKKKKKKKEKVEKNRQKLKTLKLQVSMKIPKPIIPVHTCELGAHQSISHTSQQNRVPSEPINPFVTRWMAVSTGRAGFRKALRRTACNGKLGSRGARRACRDAGRSN